MKAKECHQIPSPFRVESGNEIREEPIIMVMATEELLDTLSACQYQNAGFSFVSEHLSYICICFSPVYVY